MKTINLNIGLKELFFLVFCIIILSFSFSNLAQVKFNIGTAILKDTLAGDLKLTSGDYFTDADVYSVGNGYFGSSLTSPGGIFFTTSATGIDDDATDLKYWVNSTSKHYFQTNSGTKDIATIDSTKGINALDHITISEVSSIPRVTQDVEVKIYMKGDKLIFYFSDQGDHYFYLDLTATSDQQLIYSGTEP